MGFINSAIDACNISSASPTYCLCYANTIAGNLSIKELAEVSSTGTGDLTRLKIRRESVQNY